MDCSVIATTADPTPLNTITWKDEFTYAACKDPPQLNCPVFESTKPVPIHPNERLVIQHDWTVGGIGWDERGRPRTASYTAATSLVFKTVITTAPTCPRLRQQKTGGTTTPPCGQYTLARRPARSRCFFMAQEQRTVFSKDRVNTRVIEIPYADKPSMTVFYNKDGLWEMKEVPRNVDTKL